MDLFAPNAKPRASHGRTVAVRRHTNSVMSVHTKDENPFHSHRNTPRKHSGGVLSILAPSSAPSNPKSPQQARITTCITCRDDAIRVTKSAKLECGHRMCHRCLKRIFVLSTKDAQLMPPKCYTETCIPLCHVDRLLSDRFKRLWNKKYDEYTTSNRLYCPSKGCGEWIHPKNIKLDRTIGRRYGVCQKCKTNACKKCGLRWHGSRECESDEETRKVLNMGKEQGWQRCYSCRAIVQLSEGCNHMKCRCGAQFCYVCGKKWKTCECPWFDVPPDSQQQQVPMPWEDLPQPPPPFSDRRDMPDIFRPPEIPRMPTRPDRPQRPRKAKLLRQAQDAEDDALSRQLQEQEIDFRFGIRELTLEDREATAWERKFAEEDEDFEQYESTGDEEEVNAER